MKPQVPLDEGVGDGGRQVACKSVRWRASLSSVLVLVLVLVLMAVLTICGYTTQRSGSGNESVTAGSESANSAESVQQAERMLERSMVALDASFPRDSAPRFMSDGLQPPLKAVAQRPACVWPAGVQRNRVQLAKVFLTGWFVASDLMRHELLNPRDMPLCPQEIQELEEVVRLVRKELDIILEHATVVGMRERIRMIEGGGIPEWLPKPGAINLLPGARALVDYHKSRGEVMSLEEALEKVRLNPVAWSGGPNGPFIRHKGRIYCLDAFPLLSEHEAVFEHARMLAIEEFGIVVGWFVSRGFAEASADLNQACLELFQLRAY